MPTGTREQKREEKTKVKCTDQTGHTPVAWFAQCTLLLNNRPLTLHKKKKQKYPSKKQKSRYLHLLTHAVPCFSSYIKLKYENVLHLCEST